MIAYGPPNCVQIIHSKAYIVGLGNGICIYDRSTLQLLHQVTGIRCIHGGSFVSEDMLFVYTGYNRFYLISVSNGQIIWSPPRPKELAPCGDMRICIDVVHNLVLCIARGKTCLEQHYLLTIDPFNQHYTMDEIPNCFRVICNLFQTHSNEITFLSYQSAEKGIQWFIRSLNTPERVIGNNHTVWVPCFHSEQFVILADHLSRRLMCIDLNQKVEFPLTLPSQWYEREPTIHFLTKTSMPYPLPNVSHISQDEKYLLAYTYDMFIVIDLQNNQVLTTYLGENIFCGTILDSMCLIGCKDGIKIHPFQGS